jgi:general secretion pathway protein N
MQRTLPSNSTGAAWGWAAAGLVAGAVLATLWWAPANWLVRAVGAASQGKVVLGDATGTVWSGSAGLTLTGGAGSRDAVRLPGRVHWALAPGWGSVRMTLQADCCTSTPLELVLAPGWPGWKLQMARHQSRWPASLLAGLGTPWNTLQLQGNLVLDTPGLVVTTVMDRWTLQGNLQIDAQDMQSRLSGLRPLGSYRLGVAGGDQAALTLVTQRGALQLQGQGRWTAGRLRFQGEASAAPEHAQELSNLLNIIGRREGARSVITLG